MEGRRIRETVVGDELSALLTMRRSWDVVGPELPRYIAALLTALDVYSLD